MDNIVGILAQKGVVSVAYAMTSNRAPDSRHRRVPSDAGLSGGRLRCEWDESEPGCELCEWRGALRFVPRAKPV